jgi:hypothetical protein
VLLACGLSRIRHGVSRTTARSGRAKGSSPASTVTFYKRGSALVLAFCLTSSLARSQPIPTDGSTLQTPASPNAPEAAAPTPAGGAAPAAQPPLLVVIPVRPGEKDPSVALERDDRLVYVPRKSLERLRQRGGPAAPGPANHVFLSSEYAVSFQERQPPLIEARYRLAVLSDDLRSIRIGLAPVTLAGADACTVNGRFHPLRMSDDGLVVSLDGGESAEGLRPDAERGAAPGSRLPAVASRPREGARGDRSTMSPARPHVMEIAIRFFAPSARRPAGNTFQLRVPKVAETRVRLVGGGPGRPVAVETDGERRQSLSTTAIDAGPTEQIRFSEGAIESAPAAEVEARGVQLVRVGPGMTEIICRVVYPAVGDDLGGLEWRVPAGAAVRPADDRIRADLGVARGQERFAPLRFALPAGQRGPVTVAATVLLPRQQGEPLFNVPLVQFAPRGAAGARVRLTSDQVGIVAARGYRVVVSGGRANLSRTAAADPGFRHESLGLGGKDPDTIWDARDLSSVAGELTPVFASHKVRMTHEAKVSIDRLEWTTKAEIRTEDAPAFVHVLRIDPRLTIDSISIREDEVERLVRYSRTQDEVTLFLRDRAAATQDLVLRGTMPLKPGVDSPLPAVNLVNATITDGRLIVQSDPQLDAGLLPAPDASGAKPGEDVGRAQRPVREWTFSGNASLPRLHVVQRAELPRVSRVTVVNSTRRGVLEIVTHLRMTGTLSAGGPVEIAIPPEFASRSTVSGDGDRQLRPQPDGRLLISMGATRSAEPVNLAIHWSEPIRRDAWAIPVLPVKNAAVSETMLVVAGSVGCRPASSSTVQKANPPEWLSRQLPERDAFAAWKADDAALSSWNLAPQSVAPPESASAQVYSRLAIEAGQPLSGVTFLLVDARDRSTVGVRWPKSASLSAALVDDVPEEPIPGKDGDLLFPINPDGRKHRLALYWIDSSNSTRSLLHGFAAETPYPSDLEVSAALASVSVPRTLRAVAAGSLRTLDPKVFANEAEAIVGSSRPRVDGAAFLPDDVHWSDVADGRLLLGLLSDETPDEIRFWTLKETVFSVPLALAIGGLVFLTLARLLSSRVAAWFTARDALLLAAAALVWWLWLAPRVVAVGLAIAALGLVLAKRRERRPGEAAALPSTVNLETQPRSSSS